MRDSFRRAATRTAVLGACLPLILVACSKSNDTATSTGDQQASTTTAAASVNAGATVTIKEFEFNPSPVNVKVGQAVTWKNEGSAKHQVGADSPQGQPRAFESELMRPDQTYVWTPSAPGTYPYICQIHPEKMKGVVIVAA